MDPAPGAAGWPLRARMVGGTYGSADGLDAHSGAHSAHMAVDTWLALQARGDRSNPDDRRATSTTTDLRRARQRARATIQDILTSIEAWMAANDLRDLTTDQGARRANVALTRIAADTLLTQLVSWLRERDRIAMGRAARAAGDAMRGAGVDADDLVGADQFDRRLDGETLRQINQVDAGLLADTELARRKGLGPTLAEELGADVTRQLRLGLANDEDIQTLTERVRYVIRDGDAPRRRELGVTGQTKRTKAELIAHDSVQDAYNQASRGRYLRNGFRYCVYDATVDTKTTDLCLRLNEWVIDIRDDPVLIPPLHPYCRSGIRPKLDVDPAAVTRPVDVADDFMQTILSTKSYRPPAQAAGTFEPTRFTRDFGQA